MAICERCGAAPNTDTYMVRILDWGEPSAPEFTSQFRCVLPVLMADNKALCGGCLG